MAPRNGASSGNAQCRVECALVQIAACPAPDARSIQCTHCWPITMSMCHSARPRLAAVLASAAAVSLCNSLECLAGLLQPVSMHISMS